MRRVFETKLAIVLLRAIWIQVGLMWGGFELKVYINKDDNKSHVLLNRRSGKGGGVHTNG